MLDIADRSRNALKLYANMTHVPFNAIYGYKSTMHNGTECVCIKNIRDPITHEVICAHAWLPINKDMSNTLNMIRKESPVKVHAKVVSYVDKNGTSKYGLRPHRINLVYKHRNNPYAKVDN